MRVDSRSGLHPAGAPRPGRILPRLLASLILAGLAGCSGDDDPGPTDPGGDPTTVSFSEDVQPIFDDSCAVVCHNDESPNGGLVLEASASYGQLVGVDATIADTIEWVRVVPGQPDSSLLYVKILGTGPGQNMPFGSGPLDDAQIQRIRTWIEEGARDN